MKKNRIVLSGLVVMLAAASCISEKENPLRPALKEGVSLTLTGSTLPVTKVSIGEKDGEMYPLLWTKGDAVSIWTRTPVAGMDTLKGVQAELLPEGAGKTSGVFQTNEPVVPALEQDILILYPARLGYDPKKGAIVGTVPAVQEQLESNSSVHVGNHALAYAEARLAAGQDSGVKFSLRQKTAFVKLSLSTTEYAGMKLVGAKLCVPGRTLSGEVEINAESGELKVLKGYDHAGVRFRKPVPFSGRQDLYFTTLPCDLTGQEVCVQLTMEDGEQTVNLPFKVQGGPLKESALTLIRIEGISAASNRYDWYEPVETRYIAAYGEGWSYGPSNCFIAYFDGPAVEFDVKARGNFAKCVQPAYLLVHNACEANVSQKNNLEINGQPAYDGKQYVRIPVGPDYKVRIKASKAGSYNAYSSKVKLLDKDGNCIWAFNIWGNAAPVKEQKYLNGIMLDRNIGSDDSKGMGYVGGSYYQWGRPFQTGWSSSGGLFDKAKSNVTDLSISAQKPEVFFYTTGVTPSPGGDWYLGANTGARTDRLDDLWGNPNVEGVAENPNPGRKSIFDPCPPGYMVPSPKLLAEIPKKRTFREEGGYRFLDYTLPDNSVAVWPFSGCKWGTNAGNCDNNAGDICSCWGNSPISNYEMASTSVSLFFYRFKNKESKTSGTRNHGYAVRCMKEVK